MLRWETYVEGAASLVVVVLVLGWAAFRVRKAALPTWAGPTARLAELVVVLAIPISVAQILGSFGAFHRWPELGTCVSAGVILGLAAPVIARRVARSGAALSLSEDNDSDDHHPRALLRSEIIAAALGTAAVTAQWATHIASALDRGMTHPDTLWYHGPYAAQFVQTGRLTDLLDRTDALHSFASQNAELVHALLALPFGRDILSPFVNAGWAALALLAAWCIGRRFSVPVLSLLGVLVVLGLPIISGTHPGQASNDVAAAALLLAAIALLLNTGMQPIPIGFAALAAGLALATKLTVAAPIALLTIGIVIIGLRARRRAAVATWLVVLTLSGMYWFLRNIAVANRPLPWFGFHLGPIFLPATATINGGSTSVAHYLTNGHIWSDFFIPGLGHGLGPVWPLLLAVPLVGGFAVARRGMALPRLVGLLFLVGLIAYVFTPLTAAAGGLSFVFNLRYLGPALLIGFAVCPLALFHSDTRWRAAAAGALLALIALGLTDGDYERTPAWPSGHLLIAILTGMAVVTTVAIFPRLRRQPLRRVGIACAVAVAVLGTAGWWVQRDYLTHRYTIVGLPLDRVNDHFRDVHNAKVAVIGTVEIYPMFGLDLSNRVTPVTERRGSNACAQWRQLRTGAFDYVVLARYGFGGGAFPPAAWFQEPAATEVVRHGDQAVYRLHGPLRPAGC